MRMCSPQVSRSLVRTKTIINVYFLGRDAMDSSIVSQTTDTVVPPSTVMAHVSNHDAHHENGDESSRTRRRHSLGTSHDHPGLAQPTCEAVRRRRGCACVTPCLRCPSGGAGFDTIGCSVSVCGLCYARDGF